MRTIVVGLMASIVLVSACGGDPPSQVPNVVGERLDVGIAVLEDVGLEGEAIGGGTFGIVEEDNWYICEQRPAAGQPPDLPRPVKLIVERVCPKARK